MATIQERNTQLKNMSNRLAKIQKAIRKLNKKEKSLSSALQKQQAYRYTLAEYELTYPASGNPEL